MLAVRPDEVPILICRSMDRLFGFWEEDLLCRSYICCFVAIDSTMGWYLTGLHVDSLGDHVFQELKDFSKGILSQRMSGVMDGLQRALIVGEDHGSPGMRNGRISENSKSENNTGQFSGMYRTIRLAAYVSDALQRYWVGFRVQ